MNKENDILSRNQTICELFNNNVDPKEIAKRFNTSRTHVIRIYHKMLRNNAYGNPDIPEIDTMCRIFEVSDSYRGKIQSILHANGYTNFDDIWLWTDMDTFREIPEIGPKSINIIWLAQHMRRD